LSEPFRGFECAHLYRGSHVQFTVERHETGLMLKSQRRVSGIGSPEEKPAGKIGSTLRSHYIQVEKLDAWNAL
jgi:hypothetical protein